MCSIGATIIIVGNSYLYYALLFIDDRSLDVFGFRIASDITVAILAVVELIASLLTPHDPSFFIPHLIRKTLCCNQCCRCCGSDSRKSFLRRITLGVAMWIIILFLQVAISSLLPIAVVVVSNPVPSLAFVSIMIALFFCVVVFVAYFLNAFEGNYISRHRLSKEKKRKSSISLKTLTRDWSLAGNWARDKLVLIAQAFVFLVIFAIVALVVILYLNFVRAGADTNTVGGLFFSLAPSVVLGGITWAAKKHLFKELEEEEEEEGKGVKSDIGEEMEEVEESLLKIGGFSIRPRRSSRKSRNKSTANSTSKPRSAPPAVHDEDTKNEYDTAIVIDHQDDTLLLDEHDTAIVIDHQDDTLLLDEHDTAIVIDHQDDTLRLDEQKREESISEAVDLPAKDETYQNKLTETVSVDTQET